MTNIAINGIAHIQLTVSDMTRSIPFYRALFEAFGMTLVADSSSTLYGVGGRTGILITPAAAEYADQRFKQRHPGLHHFCIRARTRDDVDASHQLAQDLGAVIVHPPQVDGFAPGYYSVLLEDPDGIRIEVNHVPGKGLLAPGRGSVGQPDTSWDDTEQTDSGVGGANREADHLESKDD